MIDAMQRWQVAHRYFFCIIQGIVANLDRLQSAIDNKDWNAANQIFYRTGRLLVGAAATMKLAGDFSGEDYEKIIRPSMPEGFSGLLSADHRAMVTRLTKLKAHIAVLPKETAEAHDFFTRSLAICYDSHIHVCSEFGGDNAPSLLASKSEKTGVEMLDSFKRNRLASISKCPFEKPRNKE